MNTMTYLAFNIQRRVLPLLISLALGTTLAGCTGGDKSAKPATAASAPGEKEGGPKMSAHEIDRAGIKMEALALREFADQLTVTATIRPNQDRIARVSPRVEGRIVSASASLGDNVKAGQALAVLDSLVIGEAQSALHQAQSNHRVAQADFKRAEALSADEIISQRDYLKAKSDFEKTSAELRAAEDKLRLLGGSANTGRAAASTFAVVSPLSGIVVQKKAMVGELSTPTEPLFTVADLSTVWIEANLTEDGLAKIRKGAGAVVTVTAYPGEKFTGRVAYVASLLDKDSRTVPARIEVENKDGRLKPEMFASATIDTNGAGRKALSVPDGAILLLQGQPTVFIAKDGSFESRVIETGEKISGRTVLKSGVAVGEQVVVAGAYALKARLLKSQIGDEH